MQNNTEKNANHLKVFTQNVFHSEEKSFQTVAKVDVTKKKMGKSCPLKKVKSDSFNELDFFLFFFLFFYLSLSLSTLFLNECDLILSTSKFK